MWRAAQTSPATPILRKDPVMPRMRFPRRSDSALALLLMLSGCDDMTALGPHAASVGPAAETAPGNPIRLQSGDKVKVVVIGDDKLSGDYQVDGRGEVSVPAAGPLNAVGMTADGLAGALQRRLREREYLLNPIVS